MSGRRLRWTQLALQRLEAVGNWIAEDNPDAVDRTVAHLSMAVELITNHPGIGRVGRISGTRELVISDLPYIVVYRVNPADIEILTVMHTSMQWPGEI